MKKAFTLLDELGITYTFHDYKKSGIDAKTLKHWIDQLGLDSVINRKGTTWRGLSESEQAAASTVEGALELMTQKNSVIKRPILSGENGELICGLIEDEYRKLA